MSAEEKVKEILQQVLDLKPEEIKPDAKLDEQYGVDSTEMVEISVGLKKALQVDLADNELKKTNTVSEIVNILDSKTSG